MKLTKHDIKNALHAIGTSATWSALVNLFWVYVFMEITRLVFLWENYDLFHLTWKSFALISKGGLLFDTSAILYLNCLWLALVFLPLHLKERPAFFKFEKWVYVVCNSLGLLMNLCDTAFFAYRQHRTTMAIFDEFGGEGNLGKIIAGEAMSHWYLVLLFIAMVAGLWLLYRPVKCDGKPIRRYYIRRTIGLGVWIVIFIWGVRGCTLSKVTRPISIGYAQRFATEPIDVDLVLNTPFAVLRTIGGMPDASPEFYPDPAELESIYNPEHQPATHALAGALRGHNVVFIVLESFSQEFVGSLNPDLDEGRYKGYTPFLDSLIAKSVRFEHTFSNSGFSIDALPSLLASTPRMARPFVVSPFSINHIQGIGEMLGNEGYHTAFFHGADNESLGLQAFVRSAGFRNYFGLTEYEASPDTNGHADFDGTWGIWDEQFFQYFAREIGKMPQPFVAGVFSLSSHHPFDLPANRVSEFPPEGKLEVCRLIRYTDDSLRRFFETAGKQPWFANTVFVISADHAFLNAPAHEVYNNEMGKMKIPLIIYDPSGTLEPGVRPGIMQQIDVTPTLLGLLGYDKPFFAFGNDVFGIEPYEAWGLRWNHVPQLVQGNYVLQLETEDWTPVALYDYVADPYLRHNLLNTGLDVQQQLERKLKAIVQTYSQRQMANKVHM